MRKSYGAGRTGRLGCVVLITAVALTYATVTRIGLMAWSWHAAALDVPSALAVLTVGLFYDLLCCLFAALPLTPWLLLPERWWHTRGNRAAWHVIALGLIYAFGFIAIAEVLFWQEFEVRFNFIAVDYLVYTNEVLHNIWESYSVVWILLGNLGLTACVYRWLGPRLAAVLAQPDGRRLKHIGLALAATLLATGFAADAGDGPREWFGNAYRKELASNGPFQFMSAFRRNEIDYARFYATLPAGDVDRILRTELREPATRAELGNTGDLRRMIDNPGPARPLNLVLIMVESLSAEFMGHFSDAHRWTPQLDGIADQGLAFDNFYATGTRTDRGLEAVTLSMPPTPGRSIVKRIGHEKGYWSLGNVLRAKGYDTTFVYGGRGFFDNMNAFFAGNGYRIVDQTSVPSAEIGFENAWGMADEDIYRQALKIADAAHGRRQPFFMHIMTTSNHRPYTFPAGRIALPSGSGRPGAVQYTDWAIGDFLAQARTQAWFDDTLFVIVADHCASSAGKVDLPARRYHVPMIVYAPKHVAPGRNTTVSSQIDVAPTLLALLGMDYESGAFGRDILSMRADEGRALIANYQYLGLLANDTVTVLGPHRRIFEHRAAAATETVTVAADEVDAARAIAYYQGASDAYRSRVMAWRPAGDGGQAVAR